MHQGPKARHVYIHYSMISLSKTAHQKWCDHPFSQRNKTTEWAVEDGVGGNKEGRGWTKFEKSRGRQYRGGQGLHKIGGGGVEPLCQLWSIYIIFFQACSTSYCFFSSLCLLEFSSLEEKYDIFRYRDEGTLEVKYDIFRYGDEGTWQKHTA